MEEEDCELLVVVDDLFVGRATNMDFIEWAVGDCLRSILEYLSHSVVVEYFVRRLRPIVCVQVDELKNVLIIFLSHHVQIVGLCDVSGTNLVNIRNLDTIYVIFVVGTQDDDVCIVETLVAGIRPFGKECLERCLGIGAILNSLFLINLHRRRALSLWLETE